MSVTRKSRGLVDTTSCEVAVTTDFNVVRSVKTSHGCSICGAGGQLRRGWCEMHYQRWYRTGNTARPKDERDEATFHCKVAFTVRMWNKWLLEFNTPPNLAAVEGINSLRDMIEERECRRHKGER